MKTNKEMHDRMEMEAVKALAEGVKSSLSAISKYEGQYYPFQVEVLVWFCKPVVKGRTPEGVLVEVDLRLTHSVKGAGALLHRVDQKERVNLIHAARLSAATMAKEKAAAAYAECKEEMDAQQRSRILQIADTPTDYKKLN